MNETRRGKLACSGSYGRIQNKTFLPALFRRKGKSTSLSYG
jgi:hypothetical protein